MENEKLHSIELMPDGKKIFLHNVLVEDEELHKYLREIEQNKRLEIIIGALRLGLLGLKRINAGAEIDYIEKEFKSMINKFDKMLDPSVNSSHFGRLIMLLKNYFEKGGKIENVLDPMNEYAPIGKLRREILRELRELRDTLTAKSAKEAVVEKTPLKGYKFEDVCEEVLEEYVHRNIGDELHKTTKTCGVINGSFAGDFVVFLQGTPNNKIVFETKDWDTITQPQIIDNLERAMKNRDAKYGIFVVKYKETLPKKIGLFNEFRGNMLVCALGSKGTDYFFPEMLIIAFQWAKLRIKKETRIDDKIIETIIVGIEQIGEKLDKFSLIKTQCSNIDKASCEIKKLSDIIKNDIDEQINKVQKAISLIEKKE